MPNYECCSPYELYKSCREIQQEWHNIISTFSMLMLLILIIHDQIILSILNARDFCQCFVDEYGCYRLQGIMSSSLKRADEGVRASASLDNN